MTEQAQATTAPAVEKDKKNGVTRPNPATKTGHVWVIADSISATTGAPAARAAVLAEAAKAEINAATAATQYGRWRKYHGLGAEPKAAKTTEETAAAPAEDSSDVQVEPATE